METQKEISRSIFLTISEIDKKFDAYTEGVDKKFRTERDKLNKVIDAAILSGDKETKDEARKTLITISRKYYRSRRSKLTYLIKSVCAKHGRNEEHIRTVAGWPRVGIQTHKNI
jgi:hypothetical protein